jgi:hypothetical protein
MVVQSAQGVDASGSPHTTLIAPAHGLTMAPAEQRGGGKVGQTASYVEHLTNEGYSADSYTLDTTGSWTTSTYAADCSTPLTTTPTVQPGDTTDVCVKVAVPAGAADKDSSSSTVTASSVAEPSVTQSATLTTLAVAYDVLLVDNDTNDPVDSAPYYQAALDANNVAYSTWDLSEDPELPESYLAAHKDVVWFTGNSYPDPVGPYEAELGRFLDGGGRLLMSGQDILDQAAGTTSFVHDYLHIDWDGSEGQNDKATTDVHGVAGNAVSDGIGSVPLDHSVLQAAFEDQVTPIAPATAAFTDDGSNPDALTVADGGYKVEFLAFPFEGYGTAAQRADLMNRSLAWFGS